MKAILLFLMNVRQGLEDGTVDTGEGVKGVHGLTLSWLILSEERTEATL